jgi:ABC-type sulfate/molybdate transport systems ATPase subunit
MLCAPAVIIMLAVTAYPIGYAVYLSLQRADLRFPAATKFIGVANYATVLGSNLWWTAFAITVIIVVVSVGIEFALGMGLALVMRWAILGRGAMRTAILIPYGIVTVVAAYSWQYAWTPNTGYLANLLPTGSAPLTKQWPPVFIIILAEIWKTAAVAEITLDHVSKRFPDGTAVNDADLQIRDGEFVILVGPSGCGKSTCLNMIAGLEDITEGQLLIGGRVVNQLTPKQRDIAMVFQNYALYPHVTVRDNMAFALKLAKVDRSEIDQKVNRAAQLLELTPLLDRKPANLSGGQRQRVAMGRAIVRNPQAFLMDEPLSNLDAKLRVQMRTTVLRLQNRLGTTTVYVTHDQTEAMTLGDRVAVMRSGVIQQVDTSPCERSTSPVAWRAPEDLARHRSTAYGRLVSSRRIGGEVERRFQAARRGGTGGPAQGRSGDRRDDRCQSRLRP